MKIELKKDDIPALRIAFGGYGNLEDDDVNWQHCLIITFKNKGDLEKMTILVGDAYERFYDGTIDNEVLDEYNNVVEYIVDIINNSGIEFNYLDADDLILRF